MVIYYTILNTAHIVTFICEYVLAIYEHNARYIFILIYFLIWNFFTHIIEHICSIMSHIYVKMYLKYMYPNMNKFIVSCICEYIYIYIYIY